MMEGLNQLGQEEYIWAMRTCALKQSESDIFREGRRATEHILAKRKLGHEELIQNDVNFQTKTMASLVPDEVIYHVEDYSHRQYDACFLFGDVSGFTELCEKYTKTGISGPSRMTQVLNKYLGSMVQEVISHGGDVLKFSGDAFLAVYKQTETETMRDAVHEAIDTALVIQKNYGSYLTDVGVMIRVKLAISAGLVTFALIGRPKMSHYVVVGQPIWDVKAAEHISSAGDIIVAPPAWQYVNVNEYQSQDMPDNIHVKVTGVGPNWRSVQKNVRQQNLPQEDDTLSQDTNSSDTDVLSDITQEGEEFSIRPAVNWAVRINMKEPLRRFIITPVMKSIDNAEPFEYLTEMRQTVIVFINVVSTSLQTEQTVILADQTYKIVCSVVEKVRGCVNKVSLFDKDLMFVVIFGLRSLKHELECQVALRCARQCHTAISKLKGVASASIGVTTGKTYCGVFGHTLRREYTVISLVVNKAARLMVAYKGKVTCDRETFLHSKLESKHFILQEFKPLKGISHPGPVYEFKEVESLHDDVYKINACPLLGKQDRLQLYRYLLSKSLDNVRKGGSKGTKETQCRMLLINGDARQGKTRLLDEIVYITPDNISVNRFTLTKSDYKNPYQAIRLIAFTPLTLSREPSVEIREEKLLQTLGQNSDICALNDIFGVNFTKPKTYLGLNSKQKIDTKKKVLKQLFLSIFRTSWVIAIDDCDFMDEYSLYMLTTVFEIDTVFIVGTISRLNKTGAAEDNTNIPKALQDSRVRMIIMKPLERRYLGALACQILDVYAISAELENAVQTRSNGNPGWIESFLISLIQDKALYILRASLTQINNLGLVCPPLYMMARLSKAETQQWQHVMEERRLSFDSLKEDDSWKRYIDSCRDSYLNITVREQMEAIPEGSKIPICVISPDFSIGDQEMELSMDALILKTFDSLNFFEQLLVKCSSILGNQFLRNMLVYVMSATDKRKFAIAVQKLFEIKVLTCAKGDFLEEGATVFREKLYNPNNEERLECYCRGFAVEAECEDLPTYASCGYLQFRSTSFRDITYNLLTDHQKKEFHQRAYRYLERETRKCRSCGNGIFGRILGVKHDKEFLIIRDRDKKPGVAGGWGDETVSRRSESSWHSASQYSASATSEPSLGSRSVSSPSIIRKFTKIGEDKLVSSMQLIAGRKSEQSKSALIAFTVIKKLKDSYSLTRAFSSEDFTDCRCHLILNTTYGQLVDHSLGAGDLEKAIEAMLEYANLNIVSCNIPLALRVLEEALVVAKKRTSEIVENLWKLSLIRAKIYILMGHARLELGHLGQALANLHQALRQYEITFPKGLNKKLRICGHKIKHFIGLYIYPRTLAKHLDHWGTIYSNNLSECLAHLCTLYMAKNEWANAEMAAVWSLSTALESFSNFQVITMAWANMIEVAVHFHRWNLCIVLEVHSLRVCHLKKSAVDADDLKCVCKLYAAIFMSRLHRSDIDKVIQIGYIMTRLGTSVRAVRTVIPIIPHLITCLLFGQHFGNVHAVVQDLYNFAEEDIDSSGKVWYYSLCLTLHIETGYTIVTYDDCENFYQFEGERLATIRCLDARRRFYTIMWLWCVRNEQYEAALLWSLKSDEFRIVSDSDTLSNKISALYLLEGLILLLVFNKDKRDVKEVTRLQTEITQLIRSLEQAAKASKFFLPRLYHLEAFYHHALKHDQKVTDLMTKAHKIATSQENTHEIGWMQHTNKAWQKSLSGEDTDFWKDHSEADNIVEFQELETMAMEKIGYFTLPTPAYL